MTLYLTSTGQAMAILQSSVLNIAFPSIEAPFLDTPRSTLAWAITGYSIASAALLLLAGRLADIYGRRRIFMIGIAAFALASLGCGLAPTPGWLIGARLVQAVGGSFMVPTSLSLMLPLFPPSRRSRSGSGARPAPSPAPQARRWAPPSSSCELALGLLHQRALGFALLYPKPRWPRGGSPTALGAPRSTGPLRGDR